MKKMLLLLAIICFSCNEQHSSLAPPPKKDYTVVGYVDRCSTLLKFVDGANTCYVMDYCGSGNATISCVKNDVAPTK